MTQVRESFSLSSLLRRKAAEPVPALPPAPVLRGGSAGGRMVIAAGAHQAEAAALAAAFAGFGRASVVYDPARHDLELLLTETSAAALVLTGDAPPDSDEAAQMRAHCPVLAVIDDFSPRRHAADLAFYTPSPRTSALAWPGAPDLCIGWRYALTGAGPRHVHQDSGAQEGVRVFLPMTASTMRFAAQLCTLVQAGEAELVPVLLIGPDVEAPEALADLCMETAPFAEIHFSEETPGSIAASCDIALGLYDRRLRALALSGLPVLCAAADAADHAEAQGFARAGFGAALGLAGHLDLTRAAQVLADLARAPAQRQAMSRSAAATLDGAGAARIAAEIISRCAFGAHARRQTG